MFELWMKAYGRDFKFTEKHIKLFFRLFKKERAAFTSGYQNKIIGEFTNAYYTFALSCSNRSAFNIYSPLVPGPHALTGEAAEGGAGV